MNRFLSELQRRNVFRSAVGYVAVGWVILQAASIVLPAWGLPESAMKILIIGLIILFPLWLLFAWFYEYTPQGFIRTTEDNEQDKHSRSIEIKGTNTIIIASLTLAVILLLSDRIFDITKSFANPMSIQSIAVLPFANLSGDSQQEYFADGMQDELIGHLSQLDQMRVISRTSTVRYKNPDLSIHQIARELDVDLIVEGSLLKVQDSVRIQIQLIDASAKEDHLWSRMYNRSLKNILDMHSEVTMDIANSIKITLNRDDQDQLNTNREVDPRAYDALLKARFHIFQFTPQSIQLGTQYIQQALAIDPNMAEAHAAMAVVGGFMVVSGALPPHIAGEMMRNHVQKSLELDNRNPAGYYALAGLKTWYDWEWDAAEEAWLKVLEIDPNDAVTNMYYSHFLTHVRRFDEAVRFGQKGLELDPFNPLLNGLYAITLIHAGHYDEAVEQAQKALELDPRNPFCLNAYSLALASNGKFEESLDVQIQQSTIIGDSSLANTMQRAKDDVGFREAYLAGAELLTKRRQESHVLLGDLVWFYNQAGEVEEALKWLDSAFVYKDLSTIYFRNAHCCFAEEFYTDPKFKNVMDRLNFPDN